MAAARAIAGFSGGAESRLAAIACEVSYRLSVFFSRRHVAVVRLYYNAMQAQDEQIKAAWARCSINTSGADLVPNL